MSGVVKNSRQDLSTVDLHLTAVRVAFLGKRPEGKLRVIMMHNSEDYIVDIGKSDAVQWSGSIRCSAASVIIVCVYYRKRVWLSKRWKEFASVRSTLSLDLSPSSDAKQRMNVTFTISAYNGALSQRASDIQQSIPDSSVALKVQAAREQIEKKKIVIDKLGKIWSIVGIVKSVGEALSDIHPAIGAAASALGFLIEACEKQESCRDEALALIEQFEPFLSIQSHITELKQRTETQRAVEAMLTLIAETSEYIRNQTSASVIGNLFGDEYKEKLSGLSAKFTRAKEAFDRSTQLEVFKAVHGIERIVQLGFVHERLAECEDAHFKSGEEHTCLNGTRVDLCEYALHWIDENSDALPAILWLRGKAGSGKSTVANTIAQTVEDLGYHLSCFFCKRDDENLSNPRRLLPTLAYRFAQQHESYRAAVFQFLQSGTRGAGIASTVDVNTQFDRLFKGPLAETVDPLRPHVVIIDALDECGSPREQMNLAKCILSLSRLAPWIKVFITSRDEPAIRNVFVMSACVQRNINEERDVDDDIRRYIVSQAELLEFQLSAVEVAQLVKRAEGLFVWCSTLFKYLSTRLVPREALEPFLSGEEKPGSWSQLYQLYDRILDSAVEDPEDVGFLRAVLSIVLAAATNRPLSTKAIISFLHDHELHKGRHIQHGQAVVKKLHAVLYTDETMNVAIRAYHSSFYDFLEQKAKVASGWEKLEVVHSRMFRNCIDTLNTQLRFNICEIEVPVLNKDIDDLAMRISKQISEELQYSSRFWFMHLPPSASSESDAALSVSALLCSKKLLFWLECLSLQRLLAQSLLAFQVCVRFFRESPTIVSAANDARRFVTSFSEAMDSVPHIYLSSLFWLPQNSQTYRNLGLSKLEHLQLISDKRNRWDAVVWERSVGQGLYSVAFSPNGKYVASGAADGLVYIWDAQTGAMEGDPLHGHSDEVQSLAYSPNGLLVASGSRDDTVRIWDVKSGELSVGPLIGHTDDVISVAFSPNGQLVASGSDDGTIRVWNVQTGVAEGEPLRGHVGGVWDVTFSPDGLSIASGGFDRNIHIWSTVSRQESIRAFRGHLEEVQSVRYSPNGLTIISGSRDRTIRVWDAFTGEARGEPLRGHTDWVWSVMYSPDGQLILSSSRDFTIRIWDAASGAPIGEPLRGHNDWVRAASFSPDGLFIASASTDTTTRLWDAPTDLRAQDKLQGHGERVHAIAYSPNGRCIATGSRDALVRLWDAETGTPIGEPLEPLRGHQDWVWSVAFSPDGHFLVSGSADCTVRIWDVRAGDAVGEPLRGHSKSVLFVAYSPNGRVIASASVDATVRLWDAQERKPIGEPLQVHSDGTWSVAFSPDGHSLACASHDGTILVWDISNDVRGEILIRKILRGHSGMARSVAFSPDSCYIASGSLDRTVRIWDVQTGNMQGEPLEGHTDGVLCTVYSPNGRFIASSSCDCTIRIWDTRTGVAVGEPLQGHASWIRSVAFSPDGRFLASGAEDMKTYVYNVPGEHPPLSEAASRWLACCSAMKEQDGWVKDGETLLLWAPVPYRPALRSCAHIMISNHAPKVVALSVDFGTLHLYSGKEWVHVLSNFCG